LWYGRKYFPQTNSRLNATFCNARHDLWCDRKYFLRINSRLNATFYAHSLLTPTVPTQKLTSDTECAEYDDLERAKYGKVPSALKSSFAPNILAALLANCSGWTPAVMRSHHLGFISISPSFSVRICCRACGKTQAYGSFEGHTKNCKAEMWHLTSHLSDQERAEGKAAADDDMSTIRRTPRRKGLAKRERITRISG
jgi:hypothetical protein